MRLVILILLGTLCVAGLAAAAPLATRSGDALNVREYGATGDGTTDDTTAVQAAITAAGRGTVYFPPGTYYLPGSVTLNSYAHLVGAGQEASFIKTAASTVAFTWAAGSILYGLELEHLGFTGPGTVLHSSGTYDYLDWPHIHHCDFFATLAEGIHATLIMADIEYNDFGWHGPAGLAWRPIHSKGNVRANTTNLNRIRKNRFYNCQSPECVYIEAGYMLDFSENDCEENTTTTAVVTLNGLYSVLVRGNWFERNTTPSLFSLNEDTQAVVGDYLVTMEFNWFDLGGTGNAQIAALSGAIAAFDFLHNSGTNMTGKHISRYAGRPDAQITTYYHNHFVGYAMPNQVAGPLTITPSAPPLGGLPGALHASGDITTSAGILSIVTNVGGQVRASNQAQGGSGDISLGVSINAGSMGGTYLIMASQQSGAGSSTDSALYLIQCGYDGNHYTKYYLGGSADFVTFSQVGGTLHASAPFNARYAILANW